MLSPHHAWRFCDCSYLFSCGKKCRLLDNSSENSHLYLLISFRETGKSAAALGAEHDQDLGIRAAGTQDLDAWLGKRHTPGGLPPGPSAARDPTRPGKWPPHCEENFCVEMPGILDDVKDPFWFWSSFTAHFRRGIHHCRRKVQLEGKGRGSQGDLVSNVCSFILHLQKKSPTPCPVPQKRLFLQTFKN